MGESGNYQARYIPLAQMKGRFKPLCNDCGSLDCSNPIEDVEVSQIGVKEKLRCWVHGENVSVVVQCFGYIKDPKKP